MRCEKAVARAHGLLRKYNNRNPFVLAHMLGIQVQFCDYFRQQKGAFKVIMGVPVIFINDNLSDTMKQMVCAHELGHALLHRKLGKGSGPLMEFEIYDIKTSVELEANVFAAELLLDEDTIKEYAYEGYSLVAVAKALNVNVNMLLLKMNGMNDKDGNQFTLPEMPGCNFLGRIADNADDFMAL